MSRYFPSNLAAENTRQWYIIHHLTGNNLGKIIIFDSNMFYMKSILFLLCLVNALEVFAQQFLPFHKERPVYYQFTGDEVFYTQAAIFIDSFKLSGADTIFFHYRISMFLY